MPPLSSPERLTQRPGASAVIDLARSARKRGQAQGAGGHEQERLVLG